MRKCRLLTAEKNCIPSNTSIFTGAKAYFNLLEYYKLRFRRDVSKLFMLSCDSTELLMSMGAEQKSEIVKAFGSSTALECSVNKAHWLDSVHIEKEQITAWWCFSILRRDGSITFQAMSNRPQGWFLALRPSHMDWLMSFPFYSRFVLKKTSYCKWTKKQCGQSGLHCSSFLPDSLFLSTEDIGLKTITALFSMILWKWSFVVLSS